MIVNCAKRGWFRTKKLSLQLESTLLSLPVEIFLLVVENLSSEAILCLALTSHAALELLEHRLESLVVQKPDLLLLLERDLQNRFVYCHTCKLLHACDAEREVAKAFASSLPWSPWCRFFYRNIALCCVKSEYTSFNPHFQLRHYHARLIRNDLLYDYGQFSELLHVTADPKAVMKRVPHKPFWRQTTRVRLIDEQLFLAISHELVYNGNDAPTVRDYLDHEPHFICGHYGTHTGAELPGLSFRVPGLAVSKKELTGSTITTVDYDRAFCPMCLTDFSLSQSDSDSETDETDGPGAAKEQPWGRARTWLNIVAYHQLGSMEPEDEWKWKSFALPKWSKASPQLSLRNYSVDYPGCIIERWDTRKISGDTWWPYRKDQEHHGCI
ncbi:F-box domain-containing protein [Apiospora phragmitis]|uniref:F-box domain-containing protein n=1 Tax=Apiospora phragmitis TaxID=2905665 RepID=A0ABR1UIT3_9PEZI